MPQMLKTTLLITSATLLLCYLAFYNGFPLIYPDTGTYIRSGFTGSLPIDRPIFYGLFVRHISLAKSPWLVILVQTGILAWLLLLTMRRFVSERRIGYYYIGTVLTLVFMTSLPYFANVILADIFTPILFLSAFLLSFFGELKWPQRIALIGVMMFAASTHLSHFPTILLTAACGLALGWLRRKKHAVPIKRQGIIVVVGALLLTFLLVPSFNALRTGKFQFTSGSDVFMTNRLRDLDILKDFLDQDCPNHPWKLCPYKEDLYGDFLWDTQQSALYKTGGWEANFDEYKQMNREIFKHPKFIARFMKAGFEEGIRQFFTTQTGPWRAFPEESSPVSAIKQYFHSSLRACLGSRQIRGLLDFQAWNGRQEVTLLLSLAFLFLLAIDRKRLLNLPSDLRWFLLLMTIYALANATICASLSGIDARYQGRIAWLFAFGALLVIFVWMERHDLPGKLRKKLTMTKEE